MFTIATWFLGMVMQALVPPTAEDVREMSAVFPHKVSKAVAVAIAEGLRDDPSPPLLGNYHDETMLILEYAWRESTFRTNAVGDHGLSLGLLQLQRLPKAVAFDPKQSVIIWLQRAHEAYALCSDNAEEDRLAALCSGNCKHGRVEARGRYRRVMSLLAERPSNQEYTAAEDTSSIRE